MANEKSFLFKAKVISDSSKDPLGLNRVQVYVPQIHGEESMEDLSVFPWADCMFLKLEKGSQDSSSTGSEGADYKIKEPPVDSIVLVGFEGNDYDTPVIFGIYGSDTKSLGDTINQQGVDGNYSGGSLAEIAANIIFSQEGGYTTVNWNDNGAISVGKVQWHANRARNLMIKIKDKNPTNYVNICNKHGGDLLAYTSESHSWATLKNWSTGCPSGKALVEILGTSESKSAQDEQAIADIEGYIKTLQDKGIEDPKCLIYLADIYNQGPAIALSIAQNCKSKNYDLEKMHKALGQGEPKEWKWVNDSKYGMPRRNRVYNAILQVESEGKLTPTALSGMSGNTGTGEVGWPTPDVGTVTSKFGYRNISISSGFHPGIDIGCPTGTKIYASHDGTIRQNTSGSWGGGLGNSAVIDGGLVGFSTLYAHMSSTIAVPAGSQVKRGQFIGYSGNTGNSTGPHLHWGVYRGSTYRGYGKNEPDHLGAVDPLSVTQKP